MANIYRKPGTRNWYCNYTTADGSRVHRSTGKQKRGEAMARALELEAAETKVIQSGDLRQRKIQALVGEAGELAIAGKLSVDAARELLAEMMEIAGGDQLRSFSAEGWFAEWLAGKEETTSGSTLTTYSTISRRFVESLGAKKEQGIEHLNEKDVRKFRDAERKRGKTAKSCNLSVKIVRMALRAAHRQGLIARNPAEALSPLIEDDSTEREPFALEEIVAILAKAPTDWRGVILLGLYGGLRLRDATDLKWNSVDLLEKVVRYKPRKTKRASKEVVLPMHPSLESYFLGLPAPQSDDHWIFPNLAEQPTGGRRGLSRRFIELMWEAGVSEGGKGRAESARTVPVRSFHALRHTASSLMAKGGVSKELRMKVVGHASDDVHDHYTHHDLATVRTAIEFLPNIQE